MGLSPMFFIPAGSVRILAVLLQSQWYWYYDEMHIKII
jgi:hypothetical protein